MHFAELRPKSCNCGKRLHSDTTRVASVVKCVAVLSTTLYQLRGDHQHVARLVCIGICASAYRGAGFSLQPGALHVQRRSGFSKSECQFLAQWHTTVHFGLVSRESVHSPRSTITIAAQPVFTFLQPTLVPGRCAIFTRSKLQVFSFQSLA